MKEATTQVLLRGTKLCNFVEWREYKLVYKRYASLYFCVGVDPADNELATLEVIHLYVEVLDKYFGNVCELDLICACWNGTGAHVFLLAFPRCWLRRSQLFRRPVNFHKAYFILDEVLVAGELQEPSKKLVARVVAEQDALAEAETPESERG